ncbi:MAG: hypothetical protein AAFY17_08620 [Cyanobacteria bacterium J06642_11]
MNLMYLGAIAVTGILGSGTTALAQSLSDQVDIVRGINNGQPITDQAPLATADEPSAHTFTMPSLWWQQQRQGDAINQRLIDGWAAYDNSMSAVAHVDVTVNGQIWPLLSYLEQYAFITQFGESAKFYGYQLRIFTGNRLVGMHVCDLVAVNTLAADGVEYDSDLHSAEMPDRLIACVVTELDYFGQGAIRGGRRR